MINKWLVTGDLHGRIGLARFENIREQLNASVGIILLGDCGFNYYLGSSDRKMKEQATAYDCFFYCVRGNHEARPQDIPGMELIYDKNVQGRVYAEKEFPHIRYFQDGGIYTIGGYKTLVIGGAYSVDKYYRLMRSGLTEEKNDPKRSGWFTNELLTQEEMDNIYNNVKGQKFDIILTHTCPISIEPIDLFLPTIDQTTVNKSMENFLQKVKENITFKVWAFGHFHHDRIERPYFEQYYIDVEKLDDIMRRWEHYHDTGELGWYLTKSPQFYWR